MTDAPTEFRRFHGRLRMLSNIDAIDFYRAIDLRDLAAWSSFRDDPWRWFIRAPDAQAEGLFAYMMEREAAWEARSAG